MTMNTASIGKQVHIKAVLAEIHDGLLGTLAMEFDIVRP